MSDQSKRHEAGARPANLALGRWLGDFRDQNSLSGLLPAEEELLTDCKVGKPCILGKERPKPGDANMQKRVRAEFLRFLALGGDTSTPVHEIAVSLEGAFIEGKPNFLSEKPELSFLSAKVVSRLRLVNCYIDGALALDDALLSVLSLDGTRVAGLSAARAQFSGSVWLGKGFLSEGKVSFVGASIGGNLICGGGRFANKDGLSLDCTDAEIGGGVYLDGCVVSQGKQRLYKTQIVLGASFERASIGGNLDCTAGWFANKHGLALDCTDAEIGGGVYMESGFRAKGEVSFLRAIIGGDLACRGGNFQKKERGKPNDEDAALQCGAAKVGGWVWLDGKFKALGRVSLQRATIGRGLSCNDGNFDNSGGKALDCYGAKVSGTVHLEGEFTSRGEVSFLIATISGYLQCSGGEFIQEGGTALQCTRAKITNHVMLDRDFKLDRDFSASGKVSFEGASIGGNLICTGAKMQNSGDTALDCTHVEVAGDVELNQGFDADGMVQFHAAKIGKKLDCTQGRFINAAKQDADPTLAGYALNLELATFGDGLLLGDDKGEVATVGGSLNLAGTTMVTLYDKGLVGTNDEGFFPKTISGTDGKQLETSLVLDRFVYERLDGNSELKAKARKEWLLRQPPKHLGESFRHQPYDQLAKVLEAMGHKKEARDIKIAKQQRLTKRTLLPLRIVGVVALMAGIGAFQFGPGIGMAVLAVVAIFGALGSFVSETLDAGKWVARTGYSCFVAYGYRPEWAVAWIIVFGFVSGLFYQQAATQGVFVPKDDKIFEKAKKCDLDWTACENPRFYPFVFAFDAMLPIGRLGVAEGWKVQPKPFDLKAPVFEANLGKKCVRGEIVQYMIWISAAFGWLASGIIIAVVAKHLNKNGST